MLLLSEGCLGAVSCEVNLTKHKYQTQHGGGTKDEGTQMNKDVLKMQENWFMSISLPRIAKYWSLSIWILEVNLSRCLPLLFTKTSLCWAKSFVHSHPLHTMTGDGDLFGDPLHTMSHSPYLIFVIFFTRARFFEPKFYTQKRVN